MENNTLITIAIVIVALAAVGYVTYRNKKRKESSWSGTVVDKAMTENVQRSSDYERRQNQSGISIGGFNIGSSNSGSNIAVTHSYSITVRPDVGEETFKWDISSGMYEQIKIGDKVSKKSGTMTPEIIQSAAPQAPAANLPR